MLDLLFVHIRKHYNKYFESLIRMHDYMYESLQRVLTLLTYEINCLMNGQDGEKPINNIKQSLLASKQEVVTRGLKKKERK